MYCNWASISTFSRFIKRYTKHIRIFEFVRIDSIIGTSISEVIYRIGYMIIDFDVIFETINWFCRQKNEELSKLQAQIKELMSQKKWVTCSSDESSPVGLSASCDLVMNVCFCSCYLKKCKSRILLVKRIHRACFFKKGYNQKTRYYNHFLEITIFFGDFHWFFTIFKTFFFCNNQKK